MATVDLGYDIPDLEKLCPKAADLPETDGEPLDSPWHRAAINLLIESILFFFRGRTDFYVGGDMFIYYSAEQIRMHDYRGPDFFFVKGVDGTRQRRFWLLWDENGKYPDVIMGLLSPTTAQTDRTTKKDLYEQIFRTPEYFLYDPETRKLEGWRRNAEHYKPISPAEHGKLWSEQLGLWLGVWEGTYQGQQGNWPRFYDVQDHLVPVMAEAAEARTKTAETRAETSEARAQTAETELARLKELMAEKERSRPGPENPAD